MSDSGKDLFSRWELSQKVLDWREQMNVHVDKMTEEEVLDRDPEEIVGELEELWRVGVPVLRRNEMKRWTEEVVLDSTLGFHTTFYVPFDGHPAVFNMRPSKDDLPDRPRVDEISTYGEIVLTLES